ncbi:MAG: TlpA family protein disulfide reductase [Desulfarculus sp.]|nr:TlpA family protein disulfide reductase [Desulfarculus sp.]
MKKLLPLLLLAIMCLGGPPPAAAAPPKEGDSLPALKFAAPAQAAQARYLGLATGQGQFSLGQVKASHLLVEVFSMYCTFCQVDAPQVNQLHELIKQQDLEGKLKMVGLGAGNSEYEVGVYRKKFNVAFPLLPDADFSAHKALGQPRTPFFILLKLSGQGAPQVLYTHLGSIGQAQDFLATLKQKAGLK